MRRLNFHRRHLEECTAGQPPGSRTYESDELRRAIKKCYCPIYASGTLGGLYKRPNTGATNWEEAKAVSALCEQADTWDVCKTNQPISPPAPNPSELEITKTSITILFATDAHLANRAARGIKPSSLSKYKTLVKQLRDYADQKGYVMIDQLQPTDMDDFYSQWRDQKRAKGRKLERLKALFNFCVKRKWIAQNPAEDLEAPVGAGSAADKTPFSDAEIQAMYAACRKIGSVEWKNGSRADAWTGEDVVTFVMLECFTGLRISDAATFDVERLSGNDCFLRMHKTSKPLFTWLPDELVHRLEELARRRGPRPFMMPGGSTRVQTVADLWRRKLNKIWALCGKWEERPHPHRFRHTFVRILLQHGVSTADVAELIGDTEQMVRKHYARWVAERQQRLTRVLQEALSASVAPPKLVAIAGKKRRR